MKLIKKFGFIEVYNIENISTPPFYKKRVIAQYLIKFTHSISLNFETLITGKLASGNSYWIDYLKFNHPTNSIVYLCKDNAIKNGSNFSIVCFVLEK